MSQYHKSTVRLIAAWLMVACGQFVSAQDETASKPLSDEVEFIGTVVDATTQQPIPARIYLRGGEGTQANDGSWLFVRSASEQGTAWPYSEQWVAMANSVDRHTTVSEHPFQVKLKPGKYQIEIERGKEYFPIREELTIAAPSSGQNSVNRTFALKRWSNMAEQGWYSGETHVHRRLAELPIVMKAEELNVAFPVTFWTIHSDKPPDLEPSPLRGQGPSPFGPREDRGFEPIWVSDRYAILPRNTEYEIFSIGQQRHTLGALFVLNHRSPLTYTAPPIGPIVRQARAEGALLDLDKHNWPWSLMLIPVAQVDLFELSNNSVWRTNFGFKQPGHALPPWVEIDQESPGVLSEWGWLNFGFEMYYALLNCGFRMSPTAGTASGVHPVPLGFSRVYVHTGKTLDLDAWLSGLKQGRSFVTTGPMLLAKIDGKLSGSVHRFTQSDVAQGKAMVNWSAEVVSPDPITRVEVVLNGRVVVSLTPEAKQNDKEAWQWAGSENLTLKESGWIIMRTWSNQPDGRKRFAHTGAWYVEVDDQPVRPPRQQIDYLLRQLELSMQIQRRILPEEAMLEFEQARNAYLEIQQRAIED